MYPKETRKTYLQEINISQRCNKYNNVGMKIGKQALKGTKIRIISSERSIRIIINQK